MSKKEFAEHWTELGKYNELVIVVHTANVVRCIFKDKDFVESISPSE